MKRKFVIYRGGIRYWASKYRCPKTNRLGLKFWSGHDWPFYHGSYTPDVLDRTDCWRKFMEWIPDEETIAEAQANA